MLNVKQKRLTIFIYTCVVLLTIGVLVANTGFFSIWPWLCLAFLVLPPVLYLYFAQIPYVAWRETFSVGVHEIDYDHKRLIELINRVVSASSYDLGVEYTHEIFDKLIDYTKYHFAREEVLMEQYKFPGMKKHIHQHRLFIGKIDEICNNLDRSMNIAHHEVFIFLKSWLVKHICVHDKVLGVHINQVRSNDNSLGTIVLEDREAIPKKKVSKKRASKKLDPEPIM